MANDTANGMADDMVNHVARSGEWGYLPRELQLEILERVTDRDDNHPIFHCASVCKDWQQVLEPAIFAEMKLVEKDLENFNQVTTSNPKRRGMVRKIYLGIEIPPYHCIGRPGCTELQPEPKQVALRFTPSFWKPFNNLIRILSTWTAGSGSGSRGIELDISIFSPTARMHHFVHHPFGLDSTGNECTRKRDEIPLAGISHSWHDKLPVFLGGFPERQVLWGCTVKHACFFPALCLVVPIVKKLVLRRETRTQWLGHGVRRLLKHFPQLEEIHYEPWREYRPFREFRLSEETAVLYDGLGGNENLRRVVLFEDFLDDVRSVIRTPLGDPPNLRDYDGRILDPMASADLAKVSLSLVELSASFMVDATQFFAARQPNWVWGRLQKLALTAQILTREGDPAETNEMLCKAATAAAKMPKLDTLEVWNGKKGFAGVFRYHYELQGCDAPLATVTWRGTWHLPLGEETIQSWRSVADQGFGERGGQFEVVTETPDRIIRTHDEAIEFLHLISEVVSPISLSQIREENNYYRVTDALTDSTRLI